MAWFKSEECEGMERMGSRGCLRAPVMGAGGWALGFKVLLSEDTG